MFMSAGCCMTGFRTFTSAITVKSCAALCCPPAVAVTEPPKVPEAVGGASRRFAVRVVPFCGLGTTLTQDGPVQVNVMASAFGSVALIARAAVEGEHPPCVMFGLGMGFITGAPEE